MSTLEGIAPDIAVAVALHLRGADLIALSGRLIASLGPEMSARIVDEAKRHLDTISAAIAQFEQFQPVETVNAPLLPKMRADEVPS